MKGGTRKYHAKQLMKKRHRTALDTLSFCQIKRQEIIFVAILISKLIISRGKRGILLFVSYVIQKD